MKCCEDRGRLRRSAALVILLCASMSCERERSAQERPPSSREAVLISGGHSIADVAAAVTPCVVSVVSEMDAGDSWFSEPGHHVYSLGSGVIVSSDGVIITNSHVVAQASRIAVAFKDGRTLEAKLVGTDPKSDIAVVRVDAKDLPPIAVADSSKLRIGEVVLAIGNPFGIGQTVTMGIVSALSRVDLGITEYGDFIQTDAAINPGNSGGALVNMEGQLVGINTAIVSRIGGYQGLGFAIPSRMAIQIKNSLVEHGKVIRGWLGVGVQDLTYERAQSLHLQRGVMISDVTPNGPGARAGLERGDVLVAIDGVQMIDAGQVRNFVAMTATGKKVQLDLRRNGRAQLIEVNLGQEPEAD
jgi:Do/DeqQ family serine protease